MAEKVNSVCSICGKGYYVCNVCHKKIEPWRNHTDTSEHYKVYQILHGYTTGVYTKDEAKEKFGKVDLSDLESFRDNIKVLTKAILADEKPIQESKDSKERKESTNAKKVSNGDSPSKPRANRKRKTTNNENN